MANPIARPLRKRVKECTAGNDTRERLTAHDTLSVEDGDLYGIAGLHRLVIPGRIGTLVGPGLPVGSEALDSLDPLWLRLRGKAFGAEDLAGGADG
jgi:hypothetical protein